MTDKIRIMLVDDHALCRSGLTELLDSSAAICSVVGATGNPASCGTDVARASDLIWLVFDLRLGATPMV
jgi:DNA-binding NarL/FixJ family response regulator